jgi:hypothetical protein
MLWIALAVVLAGTVESTTWLPNKKITAFANGKTHEVVNGSTTVYLSLADALAHAKPMSASSPVQVCKAGEFSGDAGHCKKCQQGKPWHAGRVAAA